MSSILNGVRQPQVQIIGRKGKLFVRTERYFKSEIILTLGTGVILGNERNKRKNVVRKIVTKQEF